ncbi:MAG: A/G-specific adenine glycosylase [Desulfomonile tiedjei]|nr:A/G-specific adenine glycosylase [Desulfomonile tiedjei]
MGLRSSDIVIVKGLTSKQIDRFRQIVYEHFREHGRDLPWRTTSDPYAILVSEIMLQQTQVERVLPKYEAFLEKFPDVAALARAPLRDVLAAWQGLGYNRRAMALQRIAQRVVDEFGGRIPESFDTLRSFPGIGPATAGEITAFAFGKPAVFIETNIRRVFIHYFFHDRTAVSDKEILLLVEATLDREQPRPWYYALMDYGVMLKTLEQNPNRRSKHYTRQARFEGSDRQIRGLILKTLVEKTSLRVDALVKAVGKDRERTQKQIDRHVEEGFLCRTGKVLSIGSEAADTNLLSKK